MKRAMKAKGDRRLELRAARLTLVASLLVVSFKVAAVYLTSSVALLSDAAESVVNVAGALAVILAVRLSQRPADYQHPYGHHKAQYLSSAFEGALILVAAGMILLTSVQRLFDPQPLEQVAAGVALAAIALVINGVVSVYLRRVARQTESAALLANARHLITDVWTSLGVIGAVLAIAVTGWAILDPAIATLVALNIVREGWKVLTGALSSLMDERLPDEEEALMLETFDRHPEVLGYHRLRSRRSGSERFAEVDIFVAPETTVATAHDLVTELEDELIDKLPSLTPTIHVEPYQEGKRDAPRTPSDEYER
jgi:cation diffusion facilitator family transporter